MGDNKAGDEGSDLVGLPRADALQEIERLRSEVEELRASRTRLALASDAERRGIENALHEGVQQELVGLAADLDRVASSLEADPLAARRLLAELRIDVQRCVGSRRTRTSPSASTLRKPRTARRKSPQRCTSVARR
jgi:hypothetical protein